MGHGLCRHHRPGQYVEATSIDLDPCEHPSGIVARGGVDVRQVEDEAGQVELGRAPDQSVPRRVTLAIVMTAHPGRIRSQQAGIVLCAVVGCFNPGDSATTEGASGSTTGADTTTGQPPTTTLASVTDGTTSTTSSSTTSTSGASGTATTGAASESSTGLPPGCGDAVQLDPEECDDGNMQDGDGCSATCLRERLVFVTSQTYGVMQLGGVQGANTLCNNVAAASGNVTLAGKTFVAWIGDQTTSPAMQVGVAQGPYYLLDQPPTKIADNSAGLSETLKAPIAVTEQGIGLEPVALDCNTGLGLVWTGAEVTGMSVPDLNCEGWTSNDQGFGGAAGQPHAVDAAWSWACTVPCDMPLHLYCFEQ